MWCHYNSTYMINTSRLGTCVCGGGIHPWPNTSAPDTSAEAPHCKVDTWTHGGAPHSLMVSFPRLCVRVPCLVGQPHRKGHKQWPGSGGEHDPPHMYVRFLSHPGDNWTHLDRQHGRPVVEVERVSHFHFPTSPHTPAAGHPPAVSPLHLLPRFCKWGGKNNLRLPVPIPGPHQNRSNILHGPNIPPKVSLETMDSAKCTNLHDSFRAVVDNITEVLSSRWAYATNTAAYGHWVKQDALFRDVEIYPLLFLYRYPVLLLNAFARNYRTRKTAPRKCQVYSGIVGESVRSIGQAIATMGTKNLRLTNQGELYICLLFQFWCYMKQDTTPILVKPTPLQLLRNIKRNWRSLRWPIHPSRIWNDYNCILLPPLTGG